MLISLHWLSIKQCIKFDKYKLLISYICFPLLWMYIAPLPLMLSVLIHSPQIPLIIFWQTALCPMSPCVTWKVSVQSLSNIRRLRCGALFQYRSVSLHLSHLLNAASKHSSFMLPSLETLPAAATLSAALFLCGVVMCVWDSVRVWMCWCLCVIILGVVECKML